MTTSLLLASFCQLPVWPISRRPKQCHPLLPFFYLDLHVKFFSPQILSVPLCQVTVGNTIVRSELKICLIYCSQIVISPCPLKWTFRSESPNGFLSEKKHVLRCLNVERRFLSWQSPWMRGPGKCCLALAEVTLYRPSWMLSLSN